MNHEKTTRLVTTAVLIALATVLSMITILKLPLGGSITPLSMLPICLISVKYGIKWGTFSGFLYALLQLALDLGAAMSWGLTAFSLTGCLIFDYLLAFTVLGFSGILRHKGVRGACIGIATAIAMRYACHVISGGIFLTQFKGFDNAWLWSLYYNGAFMLPECILTTIGAYALLRIPTTQKLLA